MVSTRGSRSGKRLSRSFYDRPTLDVARDLLGCGITYESPHGRLTARIVEVEAYIGENDPACHASAGKTARTAPMFGKPGHAYIYFIYGMYYCLNFVTESEGRPAAVLLRAAEPTDGLDIMRTNSPRQPDHLLLAGPGKFCKALGLTTDQNGWDLTKSGLYLTEPQEPVKKIATSPRIGISKATRREWRFFDADSSSVSKVSAGRIRKRSAADAAQSHRSAVTES
ncbi:DNA-3-methyladenine glycosylase [bacterium]|nr:DNA-3-methyladenine glycosylase [bacterium]MCB2201708.1 DNA-3-methyladenine glycosylase [bacterium]